MMYAVWRLDWCVRDWSTSAEEKADTTRGQNLEAYAKLWVLVVQEITTSHTKWLLHQQIQLSFLMAETFLIKFHFVVVCASVLNGIFHLSAELHNRIATTANHLRSIDAYHPWPATMINMFVLFNCHQPSSKWERGYWTKSHSALCLILFCFFFQNYRLPDRLLTDILGAIWINNPTYE